MVRGNPISASSGERKSGAWTWRAHLWLPQTDAWGVDHPPSVRRHDHPDKADRWRWWLDVAALTQLRTQLRLARPLVADRPLAWERRYDDPGRLTPERVRRVVLALLGSWARSPSRRKTLRRLTGTAQRTPLWAGQELPGDQQERLRREDRECKSIAMYIKRIAILSVVTMHAKSLVLVFLVVALALILGIVIAAFLASPYMRCQEAKRNPRAVRAPVDALRR